jgi:hypothetical protein
MMKSSSFKKIKSSSSEEEAEASYPSTSIPIARSFSNRWCCSMRWTKNSPLEGRGLYTMWLGSCCSKESIGRRSAPSCPKPASLDTQRKLDGNRDGDTPIGPAWQSRVWCYLQTPGSARMCWRIRQST